MDPVFYYALILKRINEVNRKETLIILFYYLSHEPQEHFRNSIVKKGPNSQKIPSSYKSTCKPSSISLFPNFAR